MDADEEALTGRRSKRVWIAAGVAVPFLAIMAAGVWFFLSSRSDARDKVLVEHVTGASFGCVASLRGDAPESWGLERALEHMSRMARVTEDRADPTTGPERARFAVLAADAARGCEELGSLMMQARRESPDLYFAVPAALAQPPDQEHPERWFRRALPHSRVDALELARQIRAMADAINARRTERSLMAQELPIEGRGPSELARMIALGRLPRDRERVRASIQPLADGVVVIRRGSIGNVPCEMRFLDRASCFNEFVQTVSWEGEVSEILALERPASVTYWAALTATPDGSIWAVGRDNRNRGVAGRYPLGETVPELGPVPAAIDGAANIVAVGGGVAVFTGEGAAFLTTDGVMRFQAASTTPLPVVLSATLGAVAGIELEHIGRLSLSGSEEDGWTSRLTPTEGDDVLLRMLDAHSRVRAIPELRSLRSGKAAALLQRTEDGPDAVILTTDFGRSWLGGEAAAPSP